MKELIKIIKTGRQEEVVKAQKEIEKYWHGILHPLSKKELQKYEVFLEEIEHFDQITDIDHQTYFINTLKWPFFVIGDKHFNFFARFILRCIQNPSGKIRQAVLHATDWLTMSTDIEVPSYGAKKLTDEDLALIEKNKILYFEFVEEVEKLIKKYHEPKFNKYTYIDRIPAGIYKSLQYLLCDRLLRTEKYEMMYENYLRSQYTPVASRKPPSIANQVNAMLARQKIMEKRKEIEQELAEMLKETESDFSIEDIKDIIFNEEGQDDLTDVIMMFDNGQGAGELENVMDTINDAWNYFPHKILNGLSPAEKILEYPQRSDTELP